MALIWMSQRRWLCVEGSRGKGKGKEVILESAVWSTCLHPLLVQTHFAHRLAKGGSSDGYATLFNPSSAFSAVTLPLVAGVRAKGVKTKVTGAKEQNHSCKARLRIPQIYYLSQTRLKRFL